MKSRHDASLSDASLAAFASMHVDASLSYYLIGECGYANDLWLNTEVATLPRKGRCEAKQVQRHFALLIIDTLVWFQKVHLYWISMVRICFAHV